MDLWQLYLKEGLQEVSDLWGEERVLSLLLDARRLRISATDAKKGLVTLEVSGACFDGPCSFSRSLKATQLTQDQKAVVVSAVAEKGPGTATTRRVAAALKQKEETSKARPKTP